MPSISVVINGKQTVSGATKGATSAIQDLKTQAKAGISSVNAITLGINQALELVQKGISAAKKVLEGADLGARIQQTTNTFNAMAAQAGRSRGSRRSSPGFRRLAEPKQR